MAERAEAAVRTLGEHRRTRRGLVVRLGAAGGRALYVAEWVGGVMADARLMLVARAGIRAGNAVECRWVWAGALCVNWLNRTQPGMSPRPLLLLELLSLSCWGQAGQLSQQAPNPTQPAASQDPHAAAAAAPVPSTTSLTSIKAPLVLRLMTEGRGEGSYVISRFKVKHSLDAWVVGIGCAQPGGRLML